jgi:hypothetical protein
VLDVVEVAVLMSTKTDVGYVAYGFIEGREFMSGKYRAGQLDELKRHTADWTGRRIEKITIIYIHEWVEE